MTQLAAQPLPKYSWISPQWILLVYHYLQMANKNAKVPDAFKLLAQWYEKEKGQLERQVNFLEQEKSHLQRELKVALNEINCMRESFSSSEEERNKLKVRLEQAERALLGEAAYASHEVARQDALDRMLSGSSTCKK